MSMDKLGVIIGRFQVEDLHIGHRHLFDSVIRRHKNVLVILGVIDANPTPRNPMSFEPRYWMIKKHYPNLPIVYVKDTESDSYWSANVDKIIAAEFGQMNAVLYGSRDNSLGYYSGIHEVCELHTIGDYSGTTSRKNLEALPNSNEFRRGLIYSAISRFPIAYPTVDVVLWKKELSQYKVLLGYKEKSKCWCFIGGFVDPEKDQCLEDAAKRELLEEAGSNFECTSFKYLTSMKIDDWRYKNEKDCIMTTVFTAMYIYGKPEAGDDIDEVKWFTLDEAEPILGNPHKPILEVFRSFINKENQEK